MGKMNGVKNKESICNSTTPLSKQKISDEYILKSAVSSQEDSKLVVALSSHEIMFFDVKSGIKTLSFKGHTDTITGVKFSQENPNIFLSSSTDGNLLLWDIRTGIKPSVKFFDDSDGPLKPFLCFNINKSEKYICGGTELIREDAFLIFWDFRTSKSLGGYWNAHTADITHVLFSQESDSDLASSSVDGLINLYDLTCSSEDDALINTLNTDDCVNSFSWGAQDQISCITGIEDYQFWKADMTSPIMKMNKSDVSKLVQLPVDYLIETFMYTEFFYLATGSFNGGVQLFSQTGKKLKLLAAFEKGHSDVVRTVCYTKENRLITGGEDGTLCIWNTSL